MFCSPAYKPHRHISRTLSGPSNYEIYNYNTRQSTELLKLRNFVFLSPPRELFGGRGVLYMHDRVKLNFFVIVFMNKYYVLLNLKRRKTYKINKKMRNFTINFGKYRLLRQNFLVNFGQI